MPGPSSQRYGSSHVPAPAARFRFLLEGTSVAIRSMVSEFILIAARAAS